MTYEGVHFSLQCDHAPRSQARCPYLPESYFFFLEENPDIGEMEPRVLSYCPNHKDQFGPVSGTNEFIQFNTLPELLAHIDAMTVHGE